MNLVEWGTPEKNINDKQFWLVLNDCLAHLPQRMADLLLLRTVDGNRSFPYIIKQQLAQASAVI